VVPAVRAAAAVRRVGRRDHACLDRRGGLRRNGACLVLKYWYWSTGTALAHRPLSAYFLLASWYLPPPRLRRRAARSLLTAHCSLLTAHCSLLTTKYLLLTTKYLLLTTKYLLLTTKYLLLTAHGSRLTAHYPVRVLTAG
jgi:hypothetical protein